MNYGEGFFDSATGTRSFYRYWSPGKPLRAILLVVHGLAEHSGRYEKFAGFFAQFGFATFATDLPGHGRSAGRPGHINSFADYKISQARFFELIRKANPGVPLVLIGHSMGGLIASKFLPEYQSGFVASVLSGPAIRAPLPPSAMALWVNRAVARVFPRLGVLRLDANSVSRDPQVVRAYIDDPLVFRGKVSARLVAELFTAMQRAELNARRINLPILLLHGGADNLTAPEGSRQFLGALGSADKDLVIYDGLFHEVYNEPEGEQVMSDVLLWLEQRLDKADIR